MAAVLAALALGTSGCEETGCEAVDPADAWVEVGDGEDAFAAIHEGQSFEVERGSQGGMHVWVSMQTGGIAPGSEDLWEGLREGDLPFVEFELEGPEGILSNENGRPMVLERVGGDYQLIHELVQFRHFAELPDDWELLDYELVEDELEQIDHVLRIRVSDSCGNVVEDERSIRLLFPPRTSGDDDDDVPSLSMQ